MSLDPFFQIFNENRPFISPDSSKWPKEWREIHFKSYPRFKEIRLPKAKLNDRFSLKKALLGRRSKRDFLGKTPLSLQALSNLLFYSAGISYPKNYSSQKIPNLNRTRRTYPSGGARYPLETYLFLFKGKGLKAGLYHYNVLKHSLEKILGREVLELKKSYQGRFIEKAGGIIVISAIESRSLIKYGNLAYKLILLEAGHLGQNIYLVSQVLGLKCCALGDFDKELIHKFLDIDGITEIAFYALAIGY